MAPRRWAFGSCNGSPVVAVATAALQDLCRIAGKQYGPRLLGAAASNENLASQRVLAKAGFVLTGPAQLGGRQGRGYELVLADS